MAHKEAALSAEASNLEENSIEEPTDVVDAKLKRAEARKLRELIKIIISARLGGADWLIVDIKPYPVIAISQGK